MVWGGRYVFKQQAALVLLVHHTVVSASACTQTPSQPDRNVRLRS